jgi:hypothetical protein
MLLRGGAGGCTVYVYQVLCRVLKQFYSFTLFTVFDEELVTDDFTPDVYPVRYCGMDRVIDSGIDSRQIA